MSKPLHGVTEGVTVTCPNVTSAARGQPKTASVSASSGDRQTVPPEGSADDMPTTGKRFSTYPIQRRGSRKKTLSLNPEEREALENLIEEVIMGGVGEGVIDSDASSSDEDDDAIDDQLPSSTQNSLSGSPTVVAVGDASRQDAYVKGGKKFYPGQLKVALKHMHDLPPRFVRKLAKAQQYLDAGGIVCSKPVVSVGRIDEEEETTAHPKDDSKRPKPEAVAATLVTNVQDKTRLKENKLKDAKKMIRTLLTDRDQYVDEALNTAVVSSHSNSASSDDVPPSTMSTSSDEKSQSTAAYHQHDAATRQAVSGSSVSVGENTVTTSVRSFSTVVTCTSSTHVYHPSTGSNVPNKVAEYVPKTSDFNYRAGQSSNLSTSGSRPIPVQSFQSPSLGIPQYQLSVPIVHGMKPAPVLSQSPPGTQYWIPQAVVPSNAPGYYGSSPPVVGMTGVPSAFSQPLPYAYSIQSSYPTVEGVPTSYTPQYLYSASPPNQGLVGQPYSAATFAQPVSYPLTVLHPDHYVRPPSAASTSFYQNTPPPGYCPTQSHTTRDQRHMFAGDVPPPMDGTVKQMIPVDRIHNLSAFSAPVMANHKSPPQLVNCSGDTRVAYRKPVCTVSTGFNASDDRAIRPSSQHSSGYRSPDHGARMRSHAQRSSPDPGSALNSHRPRFSKSPVNVHLPSPRSPKLSSSSPHSVLNPVAAAGPQSPRTARPVVSDECALDSAAAEKTTPTTAIEHSDTEFSDRDAEPLHSQHSAPSNFSSPISNTGILSNSLSAEHENHSYTDGCDTLAGIAGCNKICSTTVATKQESDTGNAAEEKLDLPCPLSCTSNMSSAQRDDNNSDISGTATVLSVNKNSAGVGIASKSSDNRDVIQSHTGDSLGESTVTSIGQVGVMDPESTEDHLASELQSALNCTSEAETSNTSSFDELQFQQSSPNAAGSETLATVADEVADISCDCAGTGGSSTSELVITLSSSLRSALVDMFGPPVNCDTDRGMS